MRHTFAGLLGLDVTTTLDEFIVKGGGVQYRRRNLPAGDVDTAVWRVAPYFSLLRTGRRTSRMLIIPDLMRPSTTLTSADRINGGVGKLPHHLASWQRTGLWFNLVTRLNYDVEEEMVQLQLRFAKSVQDAYAVWSDQMKEMGL